MLNYIETLIINTLYPQGFIIKCILYTIYFIKDLDLKYIYFVSS